MTLARCLVILLLVGVPQLVLIVMDLVVIVRQRRCISRLLEANESLRSEHAALLYDHMHVLTRHCGDEHRGEA